MASYRKTHSGCRGGRHCKLVAHNPRSRGREGHLARAFELLSASKSAQTPVGIVKSAGRKKQEKWLTTLGEMDFEPVDMTSLVIVGNKTTYVQDGLMITPRGYVL